MTGQLVPSLAHVLPQELSQVRAAALVLLLMVAAWIDVASLRIPNWLTATGCVMGLLFAVLPTHRPMHGLLLAAGGMLAGGAATLPFYATRVMGAGDVKLVAMVGAFVGLPQILAVILCAFVAGGVLALALACYRGALAFLIGNVVAIVRSSARRFGAGEPHGATPGLPTLGKLPFGLNVCVGTIAWLLVGPQQTFL